jgi:peptidyl-dipeptidase A
VPTVLRAGANRAFHEAVGSLLGFAATQDRYLARRGLVPARPGSSAALDASADEGMRQLLREGLRIVPFMSWSAGVMTRYEDELYAGTVDPDELNRRWWELKLEYQGIIPPAPRGERFLDAASKTHITNDPAEYYDYAISHAILFQLHDRIAVDLLGQDPYDTDYFGETRVGAFLTGLMAAGATRSWEALLEETTGERLDGHAMAEYFAPLTSWLRVRNEGRAYTLPVRRSGR